MKRVGIIVNPHSRGNRQNPARVRDFVRRARSHFTVRVTASPADMSNVIRDYMASGVDVIGIHGGDGTIHHTITAIIRTYPTVSLPFMALFSGGTVNAITRGLGIPRGTGERRLQRLLDYSTGRGTGVRTIRRTTARVQGKYGFIFGSGIFYHFLDKYYGSSNPRKRTGAKLIAQLALSSLWSGPLSRRILDQFEAVVTIDGQETPYSRFLAVAASSVPQVGIGFKSFSHAAENSDSLAVLAIHTSARGLVRELPRLYSGRRLPDKKCITTNAREVHIKTSRSIGFTLDGDLYTERNGLCIAAGPKVTILCV